MEVVEDLVQVQIFCSLTIVVVMYLSIIVSAPMVRGEYYQLQLLMVIQVLMVAVRLLAGAEFPGWSYFLSSLSNALLWAPLSILLMLPQYQPVDRDDNRPI